MTGQQHRSRALQKRVKQAKSRRRPAESGGKSGWMCGRSMAQSGANRAYLTNSTALQLLGDILSKKVDSALVALDGVIGDDIFLIDRPLSASLKILLHLTLLSRHQWGNSTGIRLVGRLGAGEKTLARCTDY